MDADAPTSTRPGDDTSKPAATAAPESPGGDADTSAAPASSEVGVLTGRVLMTGKVPPPRVIQVTKDLAHCQAAAGSVQDVLVSSSDGLSGAIVEIQRVPGDFTWEHPAEGYVLRQKGCKFEPHVLVVPEGGEIVTYNDDPVSHNVNTGQWNVMQPAGTEPHKQALRRASRPFLRVSCNIHSWMEAWLYVPKSPFYAKTDEEGNYRIEDVPPGSYRVTAGHPTLGTIRERATIAGGKVAQLEFTFED